MKKKLWYAVKSGRKTGLFTSWDDCKLQVIGFPGASYKGVGMTVICRLLDIPVRPTKAFLQKKKQWNSWGMLLIKR